jgi:hypothetical protein
LQSLLFYLRPRDPDPPPRRSREPRRSSTEPPAREIRPDSRSHRVFSAFAVRPVPSAFACGEHAEASSQLLSNRQTGKRCWPTTVDVDRATRVERSNQWTQTQWADADAGACWSGYLLDPTPWTILRHKLPAMRQRARNNHNSSDSGPGCWFRRLHYMYALLHACTSLLPRRGHCH